MTFNRDFEIIILISLLLFIFVCSWFWLPKKDDEQEEGEENKTGGFFSFFSDIENIIILVLFIITFFGGWYLSIKNELNYNQKLVQTTWSKYELELDRQGRVVSKLLDSVENLTDYSYKKNNQTLHQQLASLHGSFLNETSTQDKIKLSVQLNSLSMAYIDQLNAYLSETTTEKPEDLSHYQSVIKDLQSDIDIAFNRFKNNITIHNEYFKKRFVGFVAKRSNLKPINTLTIKYNGSKLEFIQ